MIEAFLDDRDEHIDRDGDPDLGFHGILRGAIELLDAKMLLDPLEEQLDLPAAFVKRADGQRGQIELVAQKNHADDDRWLKRRVENAVLAKPGV